MNVTVVWLVIFVALVAIEIATLGLTTVWFAAGALVATIASAFGAPIYIQITLFLFLSVLLLWFTRPIAIKYFNKDRIKTNAESLVGGTAVVTGTIDNVLDVGQVMVNGQEWSARAEKDQDKIQTGIVVNILGIHGVKLIVEENNFQK